MTGDFEDALFTVNAQITWLSIWICFRLFHVNEDVPLRLIVGVVPSVTGKQSVYIRSQHTSKVRTSAADSYNKPV